MSILTPDASSLVRNWPLINANNLDHFDQLFGSLAPIPYIPVLTTGGVNVNLGSTGTIIGSYTKHFSLVSFWGEFVLGGTGINMGSGQLNMTLPLTVSNLYDRAVNGQAIGTYHMIDFSTSSNNSSGVMQVNSEGVANFLLRMENTSRTLTHAIPITWAAGDIVAFSGHYLVDTL